MDYSGAIIKQDNRFLLQLRDNKKEISNPNKWGTFGGGIEHGETPEQAVRRELEEELGLNNIDPKLFFEITIRGKKYYIYKIHLVNEKLNLMEGREIGRFTYLQTLFKNNLVFHVKLFFIIYPLLNLFNRK